MPNDKKDAPPRIVPTGERWRLCRELLREPDPQRRHQLVREYYRSVTRDVVARYRELETAARTDDAGVPRRGSTPRSGGSAESRTRE
jgi:hypothetical protein